MRLRTCMAWRCCRCTCLIQQDFKLRSVEQATLLVTVLGVAYFLPSYPLGVLADRLSRKKLLAVGLGINALGFVALALAPNYGACAGEHGRGGVRRQFLPSRGDGADSAAVPGGTRSSAGPGRHRGKSRASSSARFTVGGA